MKRLPSDRRRAIGSFYTPGWIARWMVEQSLGNGIPEPESQPLRVLDPACGDGAFVLPVLDAFVERSPANRDDPRVRLEIVRDHVFGVDADPHAIESLLQRVAEWVGGNSAQVGDVPQVIAANFRCGDALLGLDWTGNGQSALGNRPSAVGAKYSALSTPYTSRRSAQSTDDLGTPNGQVRLSRDADALDWQVAFPHVAADGGFDLVIGNPPYRRELNAKGDFDRIAASPLGQRWRRARMDFWHYFLHRGLDLLKPGGRLSFIVNSYWTGSTAAAPLRERLAAGTTMEEIVLLGGARLFRDVSGRHMIFRLRKGLDARVACRVTDLSRATRDEIEAALASPEFSRAADDAHAPLITHDVLHRDLWQSGRLCLEVGPRRTKNESDGPTLGELFEVRQGIAENPPFVTKGLAAELGDPSLAGRGVFVLTDDEVAALRLSDVERTLLRPYFALSAVGRFDVAGRPSHWILYLTRKTAATLDRFPNIAAHLERFRTVLARRREVGTGSIAWWHLHWPREERLFTAPRILCHQMGHVPRFAFAEQPTFVGFSMHVIVGRVTATADVANLSLPALTAILNSSRARRWFEEHAKRRGANLDISGTILKQFPLPAGRHPDVEAELDRLCRTWLRPDTASAGDAELKLDSLVEAAYRRG
jgi:adenine-specific DNA-methyltransferase